MSEKLKRVRKVRKVKKITTKETLPMENDLSSESESLPIIRAPLSENFPGSDRLRPHNEHYVDKLYDAAKDLIVDFKNGDNVLEEITSLIEKLMEGVKIYPGLTGGEKKIIVLKVARRVLSDLELDNDTHIAVTAVVNYVAPMVIDLVIMAADGKLDLGRRWRGVKKVWNGMISCCGCGCCKSACTCT